MLARGDGQRLPADHAHPTSGFLLFVPKRELIHLDMTIEEGMKMVISGGIVGPAAEMRTSRAARYPDPSQGIASSRSNSLRRTAERPPARAVETRVEF